MAARPGARSSRKMGLNQSPVLRASRDKEVTENRLVLGICDAWEQLIWRKCASVQPVSNALVTAFGCRIPDFHPELTLTQPQP